MLSKPTLGDFRFRDLCISKYLTRGSGKIPVEEGVSIPTVLAIPYKYLYGIGFSYSNRIGKLNILNIYLYSYRLLHLLFTMHVAQSCLKLAPNTPIHLFTSSLIH